MCAERCKHGSGRGGGKRAERQRASRLLHLAERDLLPAEHLVDAGYVDAGILVTAALVHQVDVLGPVRVDTNWQAKQGQGFAAECFEIDWEAKCVTCSEAQAQCLLEGAGGSSGP